MDCKQNVQITFSENFEAEATYDFDWLKINVSVNVSIADVDSYTAKDLKEIPIKSAILQLQKLLNQEP